jgi:hypothetical protein
MHRLVLTAAVVGIALLVGVIHVESPTVQTFTLGVPGALVRRPDVRRCRGAERQSTRRCALQLAGIPLSG